jgi:hypothetical protein
MLKVFAGIFVASLAAGTAFAQSWPAAPLRYIVPFPPGGSTDIISRHLGEKLRERLGQPVVIENDLTGFFCARLNVVFFNLEEGVYGWRTRSMARSRRS